MRRPEPFAAASRSVPQPIRSASRWAGACCLALGLACGPDPIMVDETESDTESGTASGSGTEASTTGGGPTDDGPPPVTTNADDTTDPPETTDACPVGTENCLCDVGSTCEDDLMCVDGTCVGRPPCEQPEGEPNDDEASAVELPDQSCSDQPATTGGVLDGVDADWFTFHGTDGIGCFGGPSARVTAKADVVLCMYFECDQGMTSVQCSPSADPGDSPDGRPGCCGMGGVDIGSVDCGFGNGDSAQAYMRVSAVDAACMPYEIEYEF